MITYMNSTWGFFVGLLCSVQLVLICGNAQSMLVGSNLFLKYNRYIKVYIINSYACATNINIGHHIEMILFKCQELVV